MVFSYDLVVLCLPALFQVLCLFGLCVVHGIVEVLHVLVLLSRPSNILSDLQCLLLQLLSGGGIVQHDLVHVRVDILSVLISPFIVHSSLLFLSVHHVGHVGILVGIVLVTAGADAVSKLRVLVGDPDLSLEPSLLILQLPQPVLHHLSL